MQLSAEQVNKRANIVYKVMGYLIALICAIGFMLFGIGMARSTGGWQKNYITLLAKIDVIEKKLDWTDKKLNMVISHYWEHSHIGIYGKIK